MPRPLLRWPILVALSVLGTSAGFGARADDTQAHKEEPRSRKAQPQSPEEPAPTSFHIETPENERTGEKPEEVDGFWRVPGKESWLKLSGFVMLDAIHDFDAIGSTTQFVPSTIPVDGGTPSDGSEGRTTFSFRQTCLRLDSRTASGEGMIRAYVSTDFFGGDADDPQLQIRQAFFRMERLVGGGDLTIGQAYTYFMDTVSLPETLDYEGPVSSTFVRQPLVGWRRELGVVQFGVSIEEPSSDIEGADGLTGFPDLAASVRWPGKSGHLKLAGLARQLRASLDDGPVATSAAGGLSLSGRLLVGKKDNFTGQVSAGKGISRYLDDPPPDAVYDPTTGDLTPLETIAGYVGLQHWWSETLHTNAVYSATRIDNVTALAQTDLESEQYVVLNLLWSPHERLLLGIESLYGTRRDRNGEEGSATRLQLSGKYAF